ncbi:hypothetical protein EJ08DRAFT_592639 [Tothia fuscella]|uniref:C-CAP/cofactor C-like domain-containing protein n=1 Tax=Tothia fuscella TaxID=1048955 RepID=A0A9P4NMS9_9PEZI|nr:hypothetical protein EJ08DRAFT_592639 [Tothia fuscella]
MDSTSTNPPAVGSNEQFFRYFQDQLAAIQTQIDSLSDPTLAINDRNKEVDASLASIAKLSHEVKDASSYIPAYDQRTYSSSVKNLSEKLQNARSSFAPKQKFSFKSRKPAVASSTTNADASSHQRPQLPNSEVNPISAPKEGSKAEEVSQKTLIAINDEIRENKNVTIHRPTFKEAESISIFSQSDAHIILPNEACHATTSGTLYDITQCIIDMSVPTTTQQPFSNLKLRNVKNSVIICGRVQGDVHMTNIANSIIVTTCQQLRMHDSTNVDVYAECSSRGVIEVCKGIRFGELPGVYKHKLAPDKKDGPDDWDIKVDDFDWPVAGLSPNWGILTDEERVGDENWEALLLENNSDVSVGELLRKFGRMNSMKYHE